MTSSRTYKEPSDCVRLCSVARTGPTAGVCAMVGLDKKTPGSSSLAIGLSFRRKILYFPDGGSSPGEARLAGNGSTDDYDRRTSAVAPPSCLGCRRRSEPVHKGAGELRATKRHRGRGVRTLWNMTAHRDGLRCGSEAGSDATGREPTTFRSNDGKRAVSPGLFRPGLGGAPPAADRAWLIAAWAIRRCRLG